jgi:putative flippase GtrA
MEDLSEIATGTGMVVGGNAIWNVITSNVRKRATLIKFTLVGVVGYALYSGTLFLTYDLPMPLMPAQHTSVDLGLFSHSDFRLLVGTIVAGEVSIIGGFFARDMWVFTDWVLARKPGWVRFVQYQVKSLVSTLGILTLAVNVLTPVFGVPYYVATPIGVAAAFGWNWFTESGVIWGRSRGS